MIRSPHDLVGTPWRDPLHATGPGLSCLDLVAEGLRLLGIPWTDPWEIVRQSYSAGVPCDVGAAVPRGWTQLPPNVRMRCGDVILSRYAGLPSHVSLALGAGEVLHTSEGTGCVVVRESFLRGRIVAVFRCGGGQ